MRGIRSHSHLPPVILLALLPVAVLTAGGSDTRPSALRPVPAAPLPIAPPGAGDQPVVWQAHSAPGVTEDPARKRAGVLSDRTAEVCAADQPPPAVVVSADATTATLSNGIITAIVNKA